MNSEQHKKNIDKDLIRIFKEIEEREAKRIYDAIRRQIDNCDRMSKDMVREIIFLRDKE